MRFYNLMSSITLRSALVHATYQEARFRLVAASACLTACSEQSIAFEKIPSIEFFQFIESFQFEISELPGNG